MSNIEFELISPDRLRETGQADWRLCFTCQIVKKKKLICHYRFYYCFLISVT